MISLLRRLRPGRRAGWIWVALTAGVLLNSLRLRTRVGALKTVPVRATVDGGAEMPDYVVVTAAGVVVTDELRREVAAYAGANRLDVVDMVPVGLPVEQLLEVVRLADPATYASSPLAPGRGPRQATLVHSSVLERAEIDAIDQLDPVAYLAVTAELKRFAAKSTDLAVVEGLDAVDEVPSERRGYLSALYSKGVVAVMGIQAAELGLLAAGMLVAPGWGGAAIAAFCAQPYLVAAGTTVRPSDLSPSSALARPLRSIVAFVRMLLGSSGGVASTPATTGRSQAEQEADYAELLSSGIDRFFEERRDTCPICGGGSLTLRIATKDLLQFKPGEFRLDECGGCGHIFQNPRLSIDGLDFYYKD
ncbi:MAG TPA: hypothetical protein VGS21_09115, partial [Acidimicrobiales bacterium]|nr:hypothetical protein [Acidimicrobiales bacterium]